MSKSLAELYQLWDKLGDIPTSEGSGEVEVDTIEEPFLHFPIGSHREDIWHWFEAQNPDFIVGEVMFGNRRECEQKRRVLFSGPAGMLAREATGDRLPLTVLQSAKGFYLGTADESGPVSRESVEYWPTESAAQKALNGKEGVDWMQRPEA